MHITYSPTRSYTIRFKNNSEKKLQFKAFIVYLGYLLHTHYVPDAVLHATDPGVKRKSPALRKHTCWSETDRTQQVKEVVY